jgi:hypothetical protein
MIKTFVAVLIPSGFLPTGSRRVKRLLRRIQRRYAAVAHENARRFGSAFLSG